MPKKTKILNEVSIRVKLLSTNAVQLTAMNHSTGETVQHVFNPFQFPKFQEVVVEEGIIDE